MKNKLAAAVLCICMLLPATGCGGVSDIKAQSEDKAETSVSLKQNQEENTTQTQDQTPEQHNYYEELIAAATKCIVNKELEIPAGWDFSTGLITAGAYGTRGYLIEDIDGNGIDELIFGENGTDPDSSWDGIIFDIYTISDGELVHVLNGWERNRYFFCENGMIANEGSSGAADSNYSYFTFEGSKLQLVESVIYDEMKDPDNPWFYSTVSEYDSEHAEPISEEKAVEIREKYTYKRPVFIPFAEEN